MEQIERVSFSEVEKITKIGKALSSKLRIQILKVLQEQEYNVNEIAEKLEIPASSAAMHVKILEEAGLIDTRLRAAVRGSMKVCSKKAEGVLIDLSREEDETGEKISMPVGNYVDYCVEPTCGIVSREGYIDIEDEPAVFYNPRRTEAKLIWLGKGYLEYRFPNAALKKRAFSDNADGHRLKELSVSAELCSEDHEYNPECPSDITVWVNDIEVGTYTCPGDFGGRKGRLNPPWWPLQNTQYGMLKKWTLRKDGTYLDEEKKTEHTLKEFHLDEGNYISVRIGIRADAKHQGGMNLFGDCFGDYPQDIVMKLIYE